MKTLSNKPFSSHYSESKGVQARKENLVSKVVSQLQLFVEMQTNREMSDTEFLRYLRLHPSLLTLLSAANREGNVTPAIISANVASVIAPKGKGLDAVIDINEQFKELALWLIAAGQRFNFTILDLAVTGIAVKPPKLGTIEVADDPPGWRKFVQKAGGLEQAKDIIQKEYDLAHSQVKLAVMLKETHGFIISQWVLSRLMRRLGLRINPRIGGRQKKIKKHGRRKKYARIKFHQGVKQADQALRQHPQIKMGIAKFLKRARGADKKSLSVISGEIMNLTGSKIGSGSLSRLLKRLKIK